MKIAVIDIGTNSTRLLIARYVNQDIMPLYNDLAITRIGEGIGKEPIIQEHALARTTDCIERFLSYCAKYEVNKIRITATSAVRDAQNKELVKDVIKARTGLELEILKGEEEARLSYLGAVSDIKTPENSPPVVLDIGGGSTELVYSTKEGLQLKSVNIGAVRMYEEPSLIEKCNQILDNLFTQLPEKFTLIGVGGTVTTLVAIKLKLEEYDAKIVHGQKLRIVQVKEMRDLLFKMNKEERKMLKGLQPERADIIPYGTLILYEVMKNLNTNMLTVSEKDLLYGLIITAINGEY